ncbi:MAG: cell division protein FtsB [Neisseriales bacterium]|nr:MAG: cell division protein FtsB [Neisseriales bacterium]
MNRLTLLLIALLLLLQGSFWLGKGGIVRVWRLNEDLAQKIEQVAQLKLRNETLAAEINDLKVGDEAIEERARYELGMIRHGELFFQVLESKASVQPASY